MLYVVDPSRVWLGPAAWLFLAIICLVLPLGALRQHRRMAAGTLALSRQRLYVSALFTHVIFVVMVWAVTREQGLNLLPAYQFRAWHVVVGLAALGIGLLPLIERFRIDNSVGRARARLLAPRTGSDHLLYYAVCVSAGIAEELTYRGLLFTLFSALLGGWWLPALLASVAFGIVHLFQGWKSAGVAGLMGLREHIVVGVTGTLFVAIVVHMLHDAIAGSAIALKARRDENAAASDIAEEATRAVS